MTTNNLLPPPTDRQPSKLFAGLMTLAISLMPLAAAQTLRWKFAPFVVLFAGGIYVLLRYPELRRIYLQAKSVLMVTVAFVFFCEFIVLVHYKEHAISALYPQTLIFIATAGAYLAGVRRQYIWLAFSATGAFLGLAAWKQCAIDGAQRAYGLNGGPWSAIEFGMYLLILGLMALNAALYRQTPFYQRLFHGLCFIVAVYGALLTESRGPLIAFPIMANVLLFIRFVKKGHYTRTILCLMLGFSACLAIGVSLKPELVGRFTAIFQEAESYNAQSNATGSIRERLEMWRAALLALREHPLIGIGPGKFGAYITSHVHEGLLNPSITHYKHAHNEYLEAATTTGIFGLMLLISIFIVPLRFFITHLNHNNPSCAQAARAGVMLTGMYMLCGCSDNVFYRAMPHTFYFFIMLGLSVWICESKEITHDA